MYTVLLQDTIYTDIQMQCVEKSIEQIYSKSESVAVHLKKLQITLNLSLKYQTMQHLSLRTNFSDILILFSSHLIFKYHIFKCALSVPVPFEAL